MREKIEAELRLKEALDRQPANSDLQAMGEEIDYLKQQLYEEQQQKKATLHQTQSTVVDSDIVLSEQLREMTNVLDEFDAKYTKKE